MNMLLTNPITRKRSVIATLLMTKTNANYNYVTIS